MAKRHVQLFGVGVVMAAISGGGVSAEDAAPAQIFPLTDIKGLVEHRVKLEAVSYQGRRAVRLTRDTEDDGYAVVTGTDFQDGTIEVDLAVKIPVSSGPGMPGFAGVAFRARPDASHYDLFYLRPRNSSSEDQAKRNHSVQYCASPDYGWYRLRREWPSVYEMGAPGPAVVTLAGWVDGAAARGRAKVEGRADGQWVASRTGP